MRPPAIVDTKIESRFHPCMVIPSGTGTKNFMARPRATARRKGTGFTPCTGRGGGVQAPGTGWDGGS
jgi:hypothetical protein